MKPEFKGKYGREEEALHTPRYKREVCISWVHWQKLEIFARNEDDDSENLIVEGIMRVIEDREGDPGYLNTMHYDESKELHKVGLDCHMKVGDKIASLQVQLEAMQQLHTEIGATLPQDKGTV